jgi:hypothetical protein
MPDHNTPIHLSSCAIEDGSVPCHWPLASILAPVDDEEDGFETYKPLDGATSAEEQNGSLRQVAPESVSNESRRPSRQSQKYLEAVLQPAAPVKKRKNRSRGSARSTTSKITQQSDSIIQPTAPRHVVVVGNTYVKFEKIDLNNLLVTLPTMQRFFYEY